MNSAPGGAAAAFQTGLRLHPAVARLLAARGWSDLAAVTEFLFPRLEHTHSPWLMLGMEAAVARLAAAAAAGEAVLIAGDYDVDGTLAVVILRQALSGLGARVSYRLPHRQRDGYGLPGAAVEEAVAAGTRLLVTVDCGIREHAKLRRAAGLGLEVIVTDHHLPGEELPPALAILNPHQAGCAYPDKGLCGTAIAFKLVHALLERAGKLNPEAGPWPPALLSYLKLVALGTIADAVPMLGENRVLARFGLQGLAEPRNPGLRALLASAAGTGGAATPLRSREVAFRIAPRLNAPGRMESAEPVVELFFADAAAAAGIAQQLEELNARRQQACAELVAAIEARLEAEPALNAAPVLAVCGEGWHRGVLGIVASRLVARTGKPVLVAGIEADAAGRRMAAGSGRTPAGFHLLAALETQAELFAEGRFGGHAQAVGFSLPAERWEELCAGLCAGTGQLAPPPAAGRGETTLRLGEINAELVRDLQRLEPFGEANPEPLFRLEGVRLMTVQRLKDRHLKLRIDQDGSEKEMLAWNRWRDGAWLRGDGWPEFGDLKPGIRLDAVARVEVRSHPQFGEQIQLITKDVKIL